MIKFLLTLLLSLAICAPANATQSNPVAGATYTSDFTSGALDSRYTFTRASSASYYNSSGILTQASSNAPRFDYNPSTLAMNGLLIEGSATNMLLQSNNFATSWTPFTVSIAQNAGTSIDGTNNAVAVVSGAGLAYQDLYSCPFTSVGTTYSFSVYAKAGAYAYLSLSDSAYAQLGLVTINLTNCSVAAGVNATAQNLGNGWCRASTYFTASQASTCTSVSPLPSPGVNTINGGYFNGDGVSGIYAYGAQLEAANSPSSYIPTTTTAVTRAADYCINTSIGGWFNSSDGSLQTEFMTAAAIPSLEAISGLEGGISRYQYYLGYPSGANAILSTHSVNSNSLAISLNATHKISSSYNGSTLNGALDGTLFTPFTTTDNFSLITSLTIGSDLSSVNPLNGWVRKVHYWNKTLTNAQLQNVTQ